MAENFWYAKLRQSVEETIRNVPDFPKEGIQFKDITPLFKDEALFEKLMSYYATTLRSNGINKIVCVDARGFIFGSMLAQKLRKPLILARKKNKLPGELIENNYQLEYGTDSLSIKKESLAELDNFIIVDDLLATGGTSKCIADLLESQNKRVMALLVVIELEDLLGRKNFKFPVHSLLKYQ